MHLMTLLLIITLIQNSQSDAEGFKTHDPTQVDLPSLDELHRKRNFLQNALLPHIPGRVAGDQPDGHWLPHEAVLFPRLSISAQVMSPSRRLACSRLVLSQL